MTETTKDEMPITGLLLLRQPFPPHQISKKPVGTKAQNDCPASEKKSCNICGGWHHPQVRHLDYVGHAALTDRLLDTDPLWTWEPLALKDGLPAFDESGGLWIKLTVCGHTRIGYGHAAASNFKEIGSREKEVIGDALRNAAMRFGAALELWHKGELHKEPDNEPDEKAAISTISQPVADMAITQDQAIVIDDLITETGTDKSKFLDYYKVKFVANLNASQYAHALAALQKKKAAQ